MRLYDFALEVERAGRDLYQRLAEGVHDPGLHRIFAMMVEDEQRLLHQLRLLAQRAQRRGFEDAEIFEPGENVYRRLQPEQLRAEIHNDVDAYHMAVRLSDEVCRLYEAKADKLDDSELRDELMAILDRERREREELRLLLDFTNAPNESLAWGEFSNRGEYPRFGHETDADRELMH